MLCSERYGIDQDKNDDEDLEIVTIDKIFHLLTHI